MAARRVTFSRAIIQETGYKQRGVVLEILEAMTQAQLLDALCKLLEPELAILSAKLAIPPAYLPSSHAPLASRVIELLRWADAQGNLA